MTDHKELGNNLKERRVASNFTQAELAVAVEVSRKSINAVENGVFIPSTVLALKIADVLCCSVHDLFNLPSLGEGKDDGQN